MTKPDAVKCNQCIWWEDGVGCTEDSGPVYDCDGNCIWFAWNEYKLVEQVIRFLEE